MFNILDYLDRLDHEDKGSYILSNCIICNDRLF